MGIFNDTGQEGSITQEQITTPSAIFDAVSGSEITVEDEGVVITTDLSTLNFAGAGVAATATGGEVTVTIGDTIYTGGAGINVTGNVISIQTGGVITAMLADGSVTTVKIADDAITSAKIVAGAVGSTELADDSVSNAKVQANAIATANIQDASVTSAKIASGAVTAAKSLVMR